MTVEEENNDGMDMGDFLGHSTHGGSVDFLENWKKRSTPEIDLFLHPKARIIAVWQHAWPKLQELEDKAGNKRIEVWGGKFNSWESEKLLKKQYEREPKGVGERVVPPQICPMSLMIEAVHERVRDGELDPCEEMFRFVGTDPDKAKVLHAAGLYNGFTGKIADKDKKLQAAMTAAGIKGSLAWQENMLAKCFYIFTIVDAENPGLGAQVTTEKTSMGDKVKALINDEITGAKSKKDPMGRNGNPAVNPYCIRFIYNKNAPSFNDIYKAIVMRQTEVEDEHQAVFDSEPPDTSYLARKGNISTLRDSMESAYCGPEGMLNFDEIFAAAEAKYAADNGTEKDVDDMVEATQAARPTRSRSRSKASDSDFPAQEESSEVVEAAAEKNADDAKATAKAKRAARKAAKEAKAREEKILAMDNLSEGDILTLLDEDLSGSLRENLQAQLEAIQAEADPVEAETEAGEDDEEVECDVCKKPMMLSADTCPHCGAKYDDDGLIEEPEPKRGAKKTAKDKLKF